MGPGAALRLIDRSAHPVITSCQASLTVSRSGGVSWPVQLAGELSVGKTSGSFASSGSSFSSSSLTPSTGEM